MKDLYSSASLNAISEAVETETTLNNGARVAKPIEQETLYQKWSRHITLLLLALATTVSIYAQGDTLSLSEKLESLNERLSLFEYARQGKEVPSPQFTVADLQEIQKLLTSDKDDILLLEKPETALHKLYYLLNKRKIVSSEANYLYDYLKSVNEKAEEEAKNKKTSKTSRAFARALNVVQGTSNANPVLDYQSVYDYYNNTGLNITDVSELASNIEQLLSGSKYEKILTGYNVLNLKIIQVDESQLKTFKNDNYDYQYFLHNGSSVKHGKFYCKNFSDPMGTFEDLIAKAREMDKNTITVESTTTYSGNTSTTTTRVVTPEEKAAQAAVGDKIGSMFSNAIKQNAEFFGQFNRGLAEGLWIVNDYKQGARYEINFKDGYPDGDARFYDLKTKELLVTVPFKAGFQVGGSFKGLTFDDQGRVIKERNSKEEREYEYNSDGKIKITRTDLTDGSVKVYDYDNSSFAPGRYVIDYTWFTFFWGSLPQALQENEFKAFNRKGSFSF